MDWYIDFIIHAAIGLVNGLLLSNPGRASTFAKVLIPLRDALIELFPLTPIQTKSGSVPVDEPPIEPPKET